MKLQHLQEIMLLFRKDLQLSIEFLNLLTFETLYTMITYQNILRIKKQMWDQTLGVL